MQQERQTTRSGSVDSALDQSGGVGGKRRGDRAPGAIACVGEDTDDGAAGEDGYVGQGAEREIPLKITWIATVNRCFTFLQ